jgi:hypothetical protein
MFCSVDLGEGIIVVEVFAVVQSEKSSEKAKV